MPSNSLLSQLAELFQTRQNQLYIAAIAITKDRASAEDAVLSAILAVSELKQAPRDLAAYLFQVVRNKALHSNKHAARFTDESAMGNFIDLSEQNGEQKVFSQQVLQQLSKLDGNQQQVLIMKLFGDLTFDEIASVTGEKPNTVASWYRRGLQKLKEIIHEPAI